MGRIRKPPPSLSPDTDLNRTLSEIAWDVMSKHRSCCLHEAANVKRHEKKVTIRELKEIKKKYNLALPCLYRTFPRRKRSRQQMNQEEVSVPRERKKLDTRTFEDYMESLWKSFSEDKRAPFEYLDSLWFSSYRNASKRPEVLTWIKQKGIFSKKYVFVPIVCWGHWSLLIFVHLGKSLNSKNGTPCMLLLDSLESANLRQLELEIRKFVVDIYRVEGRKEDKKAISQIPFLIPKVPQQRDDTECGNYVLYFIKLFIESAPEKFSTHTSEGYPYFMTRDWFDPESMEIFCKKLEKEQPKMSFTECSPISLKKLRSTGGIISLDD